MDDDYIVIRWARGFLSNTFKPPAILNIHKTLFYISYLLFLNNPRFDYKSNPQHHQRGFVKKTQWSLQSLLTAIFYRWFFQSLCLSLQFPWAVVIHPCDTVTRCRPNSNHYMSLKSSKHWVQTTLHVFQGQWLPSLLLTIQEPVSPPPVKCETSLVTKK